MVKEVQVARIYGGMHFRTSTVHGKVLGTKVGKWIANHYFRPVAQPLIGDHRRMAAWPGR